MLPNLKQVSPGVRSVFHFKNNLTETLKKRGLVQGLPQKVWGTTGWCSTPTLLLICSSFSRENGHPLLICSSLSTAQKSLGNKNTQSLRILICSNSNFVRCSQPARPVLKTVAPLSCSKTSFLRFSDISPKSKRKLPKDLLKNLIWKKDVGCIQQSAFLINNWAEHVGRLPLLLTVDSLFPTKNAFLLGKHVLVVHAVF